MLFGLEFGKILLIYFVFSGVLTIFMFARMYIVDHFANDKKKGMARRGELIRSGRWFQKPLYTMPKIKENKDLATVRITVFKNDKVRHGKCAIVLPGGGYAHCLTGSEGYTIAACLNDLGITAVVLEYRTGFHCSKNAPVQDLARTVKFIFDNQDMLEIDPTDYALIGFSAGGNLAGLYGSEQQGYAKYHTAKPGAVILGYPWTNINHWLNHPYWNIWEAMVGIWFSERGNLFMFGLKPTREDRESVCVQNWITEGYPPTYMFTGDDDILVRAGSHTDVLAKAFKKNHVRYCYQQFYRVPHGVGIGKGTNAEGWLNEAVDFWKASVYN